MYGEVGHKVFWTGGVGEGITDFEADSVGLPWLVGRQEPLLPRQRVVRRV